MRDIQESKYLKVVQRANDGGCGFIKLPSKNGSKKATVVWSFGGGWEHVSVAPLDQTTPSWDQMCFVKDLFWNDDECVVQYHPPKSEYINFKENCLHMWKPINGEFMMPPMIMV